MAYAGPATGTMNVTNVGAGFTPSTGGFTYTGVGTYLQSLVRVLMVHRHYNQWWCCGWRNH